MVFLRFVITIWIIGMVGVITPVATAETFARTGTSCPYQISPPPAVDASEVVPEGQTPPPLPVPTPAIGGTALSDCGLITLNEGPAVPESISAESWLLADLDHGDILAARDPHARHRPASVIKVLIALVSLHDLDLATTVAGTPEDAAVEGTKVGVGPGGIYSINQLLHGLLMCSGNDAAYALATQLGGIPTALSKINTLAGQLGGRDTRVATPSGLDGPGMSTSAYDLGLFYRYAWQNPTFADIVATRSFPFPGMDNHPGYDLENDNKLLYNYPGALGGKTGYTDDAGQTFVGAASRDGRRLVAILLHGTRRPIPPWQQAARLLDYGFSLPPGAKVGTLIEPDPVLTQHYPDFDTLRTPKKLFVSGDAFLIHMGVGIVGVIIVFGLIMGARTINRRLPRL